MARMMALLMVLTGFAVAQDLPDAPSETTHKILKFAAVGAISLDGFATARNAGPTATEVNPIARPFVQHGKGTTAVYFAACNGAFLLIDHKLNKNHKNLAKIFDIAVIGVESYWAAYSFSHHR